MSLEGPRRSSRLTKGADAVATEPVAPKPATKKRPAAEKKAPVEKKAKVETSTSEPAAGPSASEETTATSTKLKPIEIGDSLPAGLVLKNEKDEDFDVSSVTAEKGVIMFLVPKANTSGCTTQACGFRDSYPDFTGIDYDVYCLSADKPSAQASWQKSKSLPYGLISDPERILITALGAGKNGKTGRSHFIFEKGTGKLIDKKIPVKPVDSPKLALEFIRKYDAEAAK